MNRSTPPANLNFTQVKSQAGQTPIQQRTRIPDATSQKLGHYTNPIGHRYHNESKYNL